MDCTVNCFLVELLSSLRKLNVSTIGGHFEIPHYCLFKCIMNDGVETHNAESRADY